MCVLGFSLSLKIVEKRITPALLVRTCRDVVVAPIVPQVKQETIESVDVAADIMGESDFFITQGS